MNMLGTLDQTVTTDYGVTGRVWHYWASDDIPQCGDTISTYDLRAGYDPERNPTREFVEIPYTAWGDYVGGTVERSNAAVLRENYGDLVITARGYYSSEWLLLPVNTPERLWDQAEALANDLAGLGDYPVLDDDHHSMMEHGMILESLDDYVLSDVVAEFGGRPESWRHLVTQLWRDGTVQPYCDSPTGSVVWGSLERAIRGYASDPTPARWGAYAT